MITDLVLKSTDRTPKINFEKKGFLTIEGKSYPENVTLFYESILSWIEEYFKSPQSKTNLVIKVEYFNTASTMYLHKILIIFDIFCKEGKDTSVTWYCESEGDAIEEIKEEYGLDDFVFPIEFIEQ